ncbi:MAG: GAF domain-containing protein [Chloroflexota bacterium]
MISRLRFLAPQYNYSNPAMRQRAQGLILMIWAAIGFIILLITVRAVLSLLNLDRSLVILPLELVIGAVVLLTTYVLIQRGRLDAAIWLFIGLMLVPFVLATAIAVDPAAPVVLVLPLIAGGVLLNRRSFLPIVFIFVVTLGFRSINQGGTTGSIRYVPSDNAIPELINYGIILGLSAIFLLVFSGSIEQIVGVSFSDVEQLKTAGRFTARLSDRPDENRIMTRALEVIEQELGFDLAQIYLPDIDGKFSNRLRLGLTQVETGTHVALRGGDEIVINEAISTREPVIVTARDSSNRSEHLIAPARESVTVALVSGGQVYGVLDVQSEHPEMFSENTIVGLQNLAMQVARETAQARRLAELERNVRDQEVTLNRFITQVSELQRRGQSIAAQDWGRYLQGRGQAGFGFDYQGGELVASADLPDSIRLTIGHGDIHVRQENGVQIVTVPIILRDQMLGALTFTLPADRTVSERQIDMLRTITNRLAVALESNRLFEQTQAQAQRERKASEIGSLLLTATDVEAVLELAAENFNEALGAVHTRVVLEPGVLTGEVQA